MNNKVNKLKIIDFEQTCAACPSQWECVDNNGYQVYIRYRWGLLEVRKSEYPSDNIMDAVKGICILQIQNEDELDGCMDTDQMMKRTEMVLDWSWIVLGNII